MSEPAQKTQTVHIVPLDSAWSMVKQTWKWFNDHIKMLLQLSFIAAGPSIITQIVASLSKQEVTSSTSYQNFGLVIGLGAGFFLWGIVSFLFSILGTIAIYSYIQQPETQKTAWQYFTGARKFVSNYFMTIVFYGLIVFGGVLLFVIPGIFWAVTFSFAPLVTIFEKVSVKDALKRSKQMVRAQWFDVFWRGLVLGIIILAISILATAVFNTIGKMSSFTGDMLETLFNTILTPLPLIMLYLLYTKLSVKKA